MSFWSSADTSNPDNFVGTGSFIADRTILTVKHLLETSPDSGAYTRELWAKPWAGGDAKCVTVKATHESLDIAIVQIDHHPDGAQSLATDFGNLEFAKQAACTLNGYFRGALQQHASLRILSYDGENQQVRIDVKQPVGYSGGAVCTNGNIWAVLTRHYQDANIHIGCAVALWQFSDWLMDKLPISVGNAAAANTHSCPIDCSPVCVELWNSLFDQHQSGWERLRTDGLIEELQRISAQRQLPVWSDSAPKFFNFCIDTNLAGDELLSVLLQALTITQSPDAPAQRELSEPARRVLIALCSVAIERWVNAESIALSAAQTSLAKGIRLEVNDEWSVYLMVAAKLKWRTRLATELTGAPPALIKVKDPVTAAPGSGLASVRSAVASAFRGSQVVNPSARHITRILPALKDKLGADPLLGVRFDELGHPLLDTDVRQQIFSESGLPTVEFGVADNSEPTSQEFAADLRLMIDDLITMLHPQPQQKQGGPLAQPTTTNIFYAPVASVGDHTAVAQAAAPQSQASVGNIHNQGSNTGAFEALLHAFVAEAKATPALAAKQTYLDERVKELKALANHPDRGEVSSKGVKRVLDDLKMATQGADSAGKLVTQLGAIKDWAVAHWPLLTQLIN